MDASCARRCAISVITWFSDVGVCCCAVLSVVWCCGGSVLGAVEVEREGNMMRNGEGVYVVAS